MRGAGGGQNLGFVKYGHALYQTDLLEKYNFVYMGLNFNVMPWKDSNEDVESRTWFGVHVCPTNTGFRRVEVLIPRMSRKRLENLDAGLRK